MFTKITAFFTSILLFFGGLFLPEVPDALTTQQLADYDDLFLHPQSSEYIYVVDNSCISTDEINTVVCLQGLVNRKEPQIYICSSDTDREYLKEYENEGKTLVYNNSDNEPWTLENLLEKFGGYVTDKGYTLYRESEFAEGLNVAFNMATAYGYLAVPEALQDKIESYGYKMKCDLSNEKYNYSFQWKYFKELKDYFNKDNIVFVKSAVTGLRDFAIQQDSYICYAETNTTAENFLGKVLKKYNDNAILLGWGETEKHLVKFLSKKGASIIPADHSHNNSYLICEDFKTTQSHVTKTYTDTTKHYCCIMFSDGDNSQWVQNGYTEYFKKVNGSNDFPMTWTFPVVQQEFSSVSKKKVFDAAGENNYFVGGGSGIGYMNPSIYDDSCLSEFCDITASAMLRSGMNIVTILDNKPDTIDEPHFENALKYYSRYDYIEGGLIMMDPDRYEASHGRVWFSNDKPFVSVRLSLWDGDAENANASNEFIEEKAATVNSYEANINSISGYSLINVHPWSVSIENLQYFVSLLDDDVVLVTADEFIKMIDENVPHENAEP